MQGHDRRPPSGTEIPHEDDEGGAGTTTGSSSESETIKCACRLLPLMCDGAQSECRLKSPPTVGVSASEASRGTPPRVSILPLVTAAMTDSSEATP